MPQKESKSLFIKDFATGKWDVLEEEPSETPYLRMVGTVVRESQRFLFRLFPDASIPCFTE